MSECGERAAGSLTAAESELSTALASVPSVSPAAAVAVSPADDDVATTTNDVRQVAVIGQALPARHKSLTSHKRSRLSADAAGGWKKQVSARSKDAENEKTSHRRHVKDHDPERLKAFNMFVRLFVDENLDRVSPISKQPKDKIQAILEACDRQFPEFHVRSRKRIRTYLKSCRRLRRCKDLPDSSQGRQMVLPHLTSPEAESILAQACENETNNAKRMRMGLDALSAADMASSSSSPRLSQSQPLDSSAAGSRSYNSVHKTSPSSTDTASCSQDDDDLAPLELTSHGAPRPTVACSSATTSPVVSNCVTSVPYRQHPQLTLAAANTLRWMTHGYEMCSAPSSLLFSAYCDAAALMQTAPTDLSVKKEPSEPVPTAASVTERSLGVTSTERSSPSVTGAEPRLDAAEVSAIRQLIAGYRESAAFLSRSADELQQLILHQNN